MLSVLDPVHGPVGSFVQEFSVDEGWLPESRGGRSEGAKHRYRKRQPSKPQQPHQPQSSTPPQAHKLAKVSAPPRSGISGRRLDDVAEFSVRSSAWSAELELAGQRVETLRGRAQLVEADAAALERNQLAHRRLHEELLAIFDAIFAEADAIFERHRLRLHEEAAELRRRTAQLEEQLKTLSSAAGEEATEEVRCSDTRPELVSNWEELLSILGSDSVPPSSQSAPCRGGAFGEEFQLAVKGRLAGRSADVSAILSEFRRQQRSSACRVFPCLLNLLAELHSELLGSTADESPQPKPQDEQSGTQPQPQQTQGAAARRLDTGGAKLADLAIVRPSQALFYKPKFGVKRQRGWFGWSTLPDVVLYGVAPAESGGSQLLVLSTAGQLLTGMRLSFDACPAAAGAPASRFEALHFSRRAQLLFLADGPNNRVLAADLCGACRLQLTGLNLPRGLHHDDLNERLFVINGGTATVEVFNCPLYPQQQQQLQRLNSCIKHPGLARISAVSTSLRCVYITDCQLGRVSVFANQPPSFALLRTLDLLTAPPSPTEASLPPPLFAHFATAKPHDTGRSRSCALPS
ncbi:hypothetical protein BOX15_Mlig000321g2 [Macrostomum lignano]|uniref:Uncharacterized protein n=1 Tax=Macrostomum lignano TaxID=282301 RepID=A0A267DIZ0_9PLAT|nr:hypothetical protein BOX15_Mlig000321g2 [Macrostomum lignano]